MWSCSFIFCYCRLFLCFSILFCSFVWTYIFLELLNLQTWFASVVAHLGCIAKVGYFLKCRTNISNVVIHKISLVTWCNMKPQYPSMWEHKNYEYTKPLQPMIWKWIFLCNPFLSTSFLPMSCKQYEGLPCLIINYSMNWETFIYMYIDGTYDFFHFKCGRSLWQAKKL
jgi:hypothetical protein